MDDTKQKEDGYEFELAMEEMLLEDYKKETVSFDRSEWYKANHDTHMLIMDEWHRGSIINALPSYSGRQKTPRCFGKLCDSTYYSILDETVPKIRGVKHLDDCEDRHEYLRSIYSLLEIEEAYHSVLMRRSDCNVDLICKTRPDGQIYSCAFKVRGLSDRTPAIAISDYVVLKNPTDGFAVAILVDNICGDWVYLQHDKIAPYQKRLGTNISIAFLSSGVPFHFCHMAIKELDTNSTMIDIVFGGYRDLPNKPAMIDVEATNTPQLVDRFGRLNESQRQAVRGILEARCRPKPYIVFGPPGTGKSQTLVEAVVQIYHRTKPKAQSTLGQSSVRPLVRLNLSKKILVCVNSNVCTDILFERLRHELPEASMSRLNAGDRTDQPNIYDIIVTTNIKSGTLCDRMQFDFILVDEAGHSNACESLVPLCLLKPDGCLVLAGDLKQLGPAVLCTQARQLGLDLSLLARVQRLPIYQRSSETDQFDKRCITMLADCYRCDPRVLAPSNKLFYHDALRCLNETPRGLLKLLKLSSPMQFVPVEGREERPLRSSSWRNLEEARVCADLVLKLYRMGIEPNQVGVATPYRAQSKDIYTALRITLDEEHLELKQKRFPIFETVRKVWTGRQAEMMMQVYEGDMDPDKFLIKNFTRGTVYKEVDGELVNATGTDILDTPFKLFERRVSSYTTKEQICKVDTIDGFQGNEKPIMIISTVRTDPSSNRLEFLHEDSRRFNVAASRAKWLTILVGNAHVLKLGKYWPEFVAGAKRELDQK